VTAIPERARRNEARQSLSILDPHNGEPTTLTWGKEQCPPQQGPDLKRLTDYLVQLACSADAAPHVARGLIRNGRIWATGAQIAMIIADRLRKGRTDPAACPGVRGFTDED
jgi:hypothetical protein